jgi:hypothetical protein
MTGPTIRTTSGIGLSGCAAAAEVALPPLGEEVRLEANKIADIEITARAKAI